jgi:DNA-directed RNA polymerases I, II, and III subunit RPABC3
MSSSAESQLFEGTFTVTNYNQEKYDRVARITAKAGSGGENDPETILLTLDINVDLLQLQEGDSFTLVLASTLNLDGTKDPEGKGWRDLSAGNERTLADDFDYVCYGKIYRFEEGSKDKPNNM